MNKLFIFSIMMLVIPLASAASVSISFDKTQVSPGDTLTITYSQASGDSYGLVQQIPTGWTASDLSPDGNYRAYVDSGDDHTLILTAPSASATSVFSGMYFVYPDTTYTDFSDVTVTVGEGGSTPSDGMGVSMWVIIAVAAVVLIFLMKKD